MKKALRKLTRLSTGQMGVAFVDAETGEILPHPLPEDYEAVGQDGSKLSEIEVAETEEAVAETQELEATSTQTDSDHVTIGGNGKSPLKGATLKTPFKGLRNIFSKDEEVQDYVGKDTYPAAPTSATPPKTTNKTSSGGVTGPDQVRSELGRRRALDEPYEEKVSYKTEVPERQTLASINPLTFASTMVGKAERPDNATIKEFLKNGGENLDPATTAWCAAFVNSSLEQAGHESTGALNARSYESWGTKVDKPTKGDIAVFSRGNPNGWQGHVGFFQGFDEKGNIKVLGGNQGRDGAVTITTLPKSRLLSFRRGEYINPEYGKAIENPPLPQSRNDTPTTATGYTDSASKLTAPDKNPYMAMQRDSALAGQEQRNIDPLTTDLNGNPPLSKEYWSDSAIEGSNAPQVGDVPQEYWSDSALAGQEQTTSQKIINDIPVSKTVVDVMLGEAKAGSYEDLLAIAGVISNRANGMGVSFDSVVSNRNEFNAFGKDLPNGVESYRGLAEKALRQVMTEGSGNNATFYSTRATTGNLPKGLTELYNTGVGGHVYFTDGQERSIGSADGYKPMDYKAFGSNLKSYNTNPEKINVPIPAPTPKYEDSYTPLGSTLSYEDNSNLVSGYQDYGNSRVQSNESTTTGYTPSSTTPYEDNSSLVSAYQDYGSSRTQGDESATTGYTPSSTTPYEDNSSLVSAYQDYGNSRSVSDRGQSIKEQLASARDEINDFKNPIDNQPSSNSYEDNPSLVSAYQDYGNSRAESEKEENSKSVDSKPSGSIGDMLGSWF
jgi:uncharacterized protein (TIGR02594 family)